MLLVGIFAVVDAAGYGRRAVVVEVVVQPAVARAEFLLGQEERVVEQGEGVHDVKVVLF